MQTFLPLPSLEESVKCLDNKRLCKQRIESAQILKIITNYNPKAGWAKHPAVLMWVGYPEALTRYMNLNIDEWIGRGFKNTMVKQPYSMEHIKYPPWFGNKQFHSSHRSILLGKYYDWYKQFNWQEDPAVMVNGSWPYWWPTQQKKVTLNTTDN